MLDNVNTAILALAPGAILGLLALGIVLIFRASGTVNLAQGGMATAGAYAYQDITQNHNIPGWLAVVLSAAITGVIGVLIEALIMRHLRSASALTRLIATAGVLLILQSALSLRYGVSSTFVPSLLPTSSVSLPGGAAVGIDRIILLGMATVLTVALWATYRYTRFGISTTGLAENSVAAETLGMRVSTIAMGNWFIAGALGGLAGALIAPITGLNLILLSNLLIPALAAALGGGLTSFPLTVLTAMAISVVQSLVTVHTSVQGASTLVPFGLIVLLMIWRGSSIPTRGFRGERLPTVGDGRIHRSQAIVAFVVAITGAILWIPGTWLGPVTSSGVLAIVMLSVVVVTGYAGQASLAQFSLAGVGAWAAANVCHSWGWPFLPSLLAAIVVSAAIGSLLAAASWRIRGTNLALVTLAFGMTAYAVLLTRTESIQVSTPTIFGWSFDPITQPRRYLVVVIVAFTVMALGAANLRRSASGRRLVAVRGDERAAAAMGIHVERMKLAAFTIASAIAAVGGVLTAYVTPYVDLSQFDVGTSLNVTVWAVIGGVGFITGPLAGSVLVNGGIGNQILETFVHADVSVVTLIGGILLVLTVLLNPDGMASLTRDLKIRWRSSEQKRGKPEPVKAPVKVTIRPTSPPSRAKSALEVRGLTVSFGGVQALREVDLTVEPGQIHGLIGPNGAGKTTLLDAVSGYVDPRAGTILLGVEHIESLPSWKRARRGLARSFQSGQLFPELTVLDNIQIASEADRPSSVVRDLLWPGGRTMTSLTQDTIRAFELEPDLDASVATLPNGRRQLVSIARAMAANPSILMLDEPAAGLSDRERSELTELLRKLAGKFGVGILLIEHDVNLVLDVSDIVTVLNFGQVLAHDTPARIRSSSAVIDAYLGSPIKKFPTTAETVELTEKLP